MEHHPYDAVYDLEIFENFSSNVVYQPAHKRLHVAYNTFFNTTTTDIPKIDIDTASHEKIEAAIHKTLDTYFSHEAIEDVHVYKEAYTVSKDLDKATVNPEKDGFYLMTKGLLEDIPNQGGTVYGFNSSNYDNLLLIYFKQCFDRSEMPSTEIARHLSNQFIDQKMKPKDILRGYPGAVSAYYDLRSNPQHLDVQNLNEKLSMTSLKRIIAQKGGRIETSLKLKGDTAVLNGLDDVIEQLCYNVSDVLGTEYILSDPAYTGPLETGTRMMEKYGEHEFKDFKRAMNRTLKRDTTSANFIEAVISPTKKLKDDPVVMLGFPLAYGYIEPLILREETTKNETHPWSTFTSNDDVTYRIDRFKNWDEFHEKWFPVLTKHLKDPTDEAINAFLEEQKHLTFIHFAFFYQDGTPKVQSVNLKLTPLHTTEANFQTVAPKLLGLQKDVLAKETVEKRTETYRNRILNLTSEDGQDAYLFYNPDTNAPRVTYQEDQFQLDLLEYTMREYYLDEPYKQNVYAFYNAYRNHDLSRNLRGKLPKEIEKGVDLLLPYGIPAYARITIGGIHGNLVDRDALEQDHQEIYTYQTNLLKTLDFYVNLVLNQWNTEKRIAFITAQEEDIESRSLKASTKKTRLKQLHGQATMQPKMLENIQAILQDKTSYLSQESSQNAKNNLLNEDTEELRQVISIAAILAKNSQNDGYPNAEPEKLKQIQPDTYASGTYGRFKANRRYKDMSKYSMTLDGKDITHADIASYYPTLITTLQIFKTGEEDRYADIKASRLRLKAMLPSGGEEWTEEHVKINEQQTLDKLLLNAASGKADSNFENNIRVSNKIHRMRIVGQLIMLALCIELSERGVTPNSINTDGVFVHGTTTEEIEPLIQTWCQLHKVDADAEHIDRFISKGTNDRIEIYNGRIGSVGGSDVSYYQGPHLQGQMSRPAITNTILVEYLTNMEHPLCHYDRAYVKDYLESLIQQALDHPDELIQRNGESVTMKHYVFSLFQYIVVSNPATNTYNVVQDANGKWIYNSPINRLLYVTEDILSFEDAEDVDYKPWITSIRRIATNKQAKSNHPEALEIANAENLRAEIPEHEQHQNFTVFRKITNLDTPEDNQLFVIVNESIDDIPKEILHYLDLDKYIDYAKLSWDNWAECHYMNYAPCHHEDYAENGSKKTSTKNVDQTLKEYEDAKAIFQMQ